MNNASTPRGKNDQKLTINNNSPFNQKTNEMKLNLKSITKNIISKKIKKDISDSKTNKTNNKNINKISKKSSDSISLNNDEDITSNLSTKSQNKSNISKK